MTVKFEDLKVLQAAEEVADALWKQIIEWDSFAKDTVGKQLVRAAEYTKQQQRSNKPKPKTAVREPGTAYLIDQEVSLEEFVSDVEIELFTPDDIAFLSQLPNHPITQLPNYPITSLKNTHEPQHICNCK